MDFLFLSVQSCTSFAVVLQPSQLLVGGIEFAKQECDLDCGRSLIEPQATQNHPKGAQSQWGLETSGSTVRRSSQTER